MLRVEPAVPVHFGVIEAEKTSSLRNFDIEVWRACEEFVGESAVGVFRADKVCLIDYGADGGVFVEENRGDEVFVRDVVFAEIEVRY